MLEAKRTGSKLSHSKPHSFSCASRMRLASALILILSLLSCPAMATRLSADIKKTLETVFPAGIQRLDGSVELPDHSFMLPLIPGSNPPKRTKAEGILKWPKDSDDPVLLIYENGWAHIRTEKKDSSVTLKLPDALPDAIKKKLLTSKLPEDLIVPQGFVLPYSMKPMRGDLTSVPIMEDVALMKPEFKKKEHVQQQYSGDGMFAMVSIRDGSIILMDAKNFSKIAEFPTQGTPSSMSFVDGRIYVTDQAKNRILMLDPISRRFLGQVDLPPNTAPRGIVTLPNGTLIFVSLSGSSEVAAIETETGKILAKTKVPIGPARMSVTADGAFVTLLSVTASQLAIIAAYNQRVVGAVKLGDVPTCMVVHPTEKTAYVSNRHSNTVSVVDLTKRIVLNNIKTGNSPTGVAISADGKKLYVALGRDNSIVIYDTSNLQKINEVKLPLDVDFPHSICLTPDGGHLIVTSQQTDTVGILDTNTLEFSKQVQVGHTTQDVIWIPAG